ncbi:MAG: transposase [Treponema sp.]|jgi:transposase|nr:transposase [Treponema sp.]
MAGNSVSPDKKEHEMGNRRDILRRSDECKRRRHMRERIRAAGKPPVVMSSGKREHISMVSAITNQGEMFFEFVQRPAARSKVKVLLIIDHLRTHKSKRIKDWVRGNKGKIALNYLPAYSPDLEPDEQVNADVKHGVGARTPKQTKADIGVATEEQMKMANKAP